MIVNQTLLGNPNNWLRVWLMATLGLVGLYFLAHIFTPDAVEHVE